MAATLMGLVICPIKHWEVPVRLCGPSMPMPLLGRKHKVVHIHTGVQKASVDYAGRSLLLLLLAFWPQCLLQMMGRNLMGKENWNLYGLRLGLGTSPFAYSLIHSLQDLHLFLSDSRIQILAMLKRLPVLTKCKQGAEESNSLFKVCLNSRKSNH